MAYTRHTWQSGEVISSALLNNIEDGIEEAASSGGGGLKFVKDSEGSYENDGETITYTGGVAEGLVGDDIPEEHRNKATGSFSHAEGGDFDSDDSAYYPNIASGNGSHAEGSGTTASGRNSHAEGGGTTASGVASHAEGGDTIASGNVSHAEGGDTIASGNVSHAEGNNTNASGETSHAEGSNTTASGETSHAEGSNTTASGETSHAEGKSTIANHKSQHVFGEYNIEDSSTASSNSRGTYVEIVGNGTKNTERSNARTLDWSGNMWLAGSLSLGNTTITEAQLQSLLALLNT